MPEAQNEKELQVENGNFTRIVNPLLDNLIKIPFKGCEIPVAIYLIRKTYGFNKTEDEISLSQFCKDLTRSKQTIVTALKNLQLVKIARLVRKGDSKKSSNVWAINKYYKTWELVSTVRLVKRKRGTSLTEGLKLVQTARHTKDSKENITKDIRAAEPPQVNELLNFFKQTVNEHLAFNNKTERKACTDLLNTYGLEKTKQALTYLEEKRKTDKYLPIITTPWELWTKWAKIKQHLQTKKPKVWMSQKMSQQLSSPQAQGMK